MENKNLNDLNLLIPHLVRNFRHIEKVFSYIEKNDDYDRDFTDAFGKIASHVFDSLIGLNIDEVTIESLSDPQSVQRIRVFLNRLRSFCKFLDNWQTTNQEIVTKKLSHHNEQCKFSGIHSYLGVIVSLSIRLLKHYNDFYPDFEVPKTYIDTNQNYEENKLFIEAESKRNRFERLEALRIFAPELIDRLRKAAKIKTSKKIVSIITTVNKEDCYQYLFTDKYKADKSKIDLFELNNLNSEIYEIK